MIVFEKLTWKNFLSTGNQPTTIMLDRSPTTLVIGANGSGKSTMLDALCFALYGKPFRSINKGQIVNSVNQRECHVELTFRVGSNRYRVVRGIKPNVFDIYLNDTLLNQDAKARDYQKHLESTVLKMNEKSFRQVVVLGSTSYVPFMQLPTPHRREVIEDLLDIGVFSKMNVVLKARLSENKDALADAAKQIELFTDRIQTLKNLQSRGDEQREERIRAVQAKIDEIKGELGKRQADLEAAVAVYDEAANQETEDANDLRTKLSEYISAKAKMQDLVERNNRTIAFFKDNDTCPTCQQDITAEYKKGEIAKRKAKVEEAEGIIQAASDKCDVLTERIQDIAKKADHLRTLRSNVKEAQSDVDYLKKRIVDQQDLLNSLNAESRDQAGETETKLEEYRADLKKWTDERAKLTDERGYLDLVGMMLKDTGIKTNIIRQYIPVMNQSINNYLNALGLSVNFTLDENFNEVIRSRYRDEFSYTNFSEGEKSRIDLAIMLTWRTIAKMKNSASTNLLVLDEVFDGSLDANATEELVNILNQMEKDINIFVISHRNHELNDKFRSIIEFRKEGNFSVMC
jgi:DNA repair exonuclease SbcCD ATPase subunit